MTDAGGGTEDHTSGLSVPLFLHAAAAAWITGMLLVARLAPDRYAGAMQEDHVVEWLTAALFAAAAFAQLRRAATGRRAFDVLVGLFCLFVAGEEISWGQRLLGFTPPAPFLAHNTQQEFNIHNFADLFGRPKWSLAFLLLAYGMVLPLIARTALGRTWTKRIGATPPPLGLMPWYCACVVLLVWYPVEFTGEWVEGLAAVLFLASTGLTSLVLLASAAGALGAAVALAVISARAGGDDSGRVACAQSEVQALLSHVTRADAVVQPVDGSFHKRVFAAAQDQYIDLDSAAAFASASCAGAASADATARRQFAVDPWGTAYWIKTLRGDAGDHQVLVYSFGPNRRRDGDAGDVSAARKDDVVAVLAARPRAP